MCTNLHTCITVQYILSLCCVAGGVPLHVMEIVSLPPEGTPERQRAYQVNHTTHITQACVQHPLKYSCTVEPSIKGHSN